MVAPLAASAYNVHLRSNPTLCWDYQVFTIAHSLTRSPTYPPTHLLHTSTRSPTFLLTLHSLPHALTLVISLTHIHPPSHSLARSFTHSLTHSLAHAPPSTVPPALAHSFTSTQGATDSSPIKAQSCVAGQGSQTFDYDPMRDYIVLGGSPSCQEGPPCCAENFFGAQKSLCDMSLIASFSSVPKV